jgi:glyoxylase-like metal-dependent hydrolase (beta-lactamase superfamily II)
MQRFGAPSRRQVIAGGLALAAANAGAGFTGPALAAAPSHTLEVGKAQLTVVSDGTFAMPLSMVLPDKSEADVTAAFKAGGAALPIEAQANLVVVRSGGAVALIDAGAGADFMPTLGKAPDALEGLGVKPDEVTHVIFTHAHADHLWGVVDPFGDGSRWPKARHVMLATERDFWLSAGVEDKVPAMQKGMAIGIVKRLKALGDAITVARDGEEVAPGIQLMATPGHTPGHAAVVVRSGTDEIVVVGDALTHALVSFAHHDWRWGSDIEATQAVATRKRLLDRLAQSKMRLAGYHLPWPGIGRVEAQGTTYRYVAG